MKKEISEKAKQTAKHIGILSEGAIQTLIDEVRAEEREKLLERIKLEFKALPNGFLKGVSATETQLYLNIRGEIIKEAIFNLEKLKSQLKDEK